MRYSLLFHLIFDDLNKSGFAPKSIEVSNFGGLKQCTLSNGNENKKAISSDVSVGVDKLKSLSKLKALCEWVEWKTFQNGHQNGHPACLTLRSEGFAAYPFLFFHKRAKYLARLNSYHEAIERYVWVEWWKNPHINFNVLRLSDSIVNFLKNFSLLVDIGSITAISPSFHGSEFPDSELIILIAKTKAGGYLTGGAAGTRRKRDQTFLRAGAEMIRHFIAFERALSTADAPSTNDNYLGRIIHFGKGFENDAVTNRLSHRGNVSVGLPLLDLDSTIENNISSFILVYRCRFLNQPEFIDSNVGMMCF